MKPREIATIVYEDSIDRFYISSNGEELVIFSGNKEIIRRLSGNIERTEKALEKADIALDHQPIAVSSSANGKVLAVILDNGELLVYRLEEAKRKAELIASTTLPLKGKAIDAYIALDPEGSLIVLSYEEHSGPSRKIRTEMRRTEDLGVLWSLEDVMLGTPCFINNGTILFGKLREKDGKGLSSNSYVLIDVESGKIIERLKYSIYGDYDYLCSSNGKIAIRLGTAILVSSIENLDKLRLFKEIEKSFHGHEIDIIERVFREGNILIAIRLVNDKRSIEIRDISNPKTPKLKISYPMIRGVEYLPKRRLIAVYYVYSIGLLYVGERGVSLIGFIDLYDKSKEAAIGGLIELFWVSKEYIVDVKFLSEELLLVLTHGELFVYDIKNPEKPKKIGYLDLFKELEHIISRRDTPDSINIFPSPDGSKAFLELVFEHYIETNGLKRKELKYFLIDLSDPIKPKISEIYRKPDRAKENKGKEPEDIRILGSYAFIYRDGKPIGILANWPEYIYYEVFEMDSRYVQKVYF